jgi:DegV family protein with EDD domain
LAIRIIIDSMCDLNDEITQNYEFEMLPIPIVLGDKTYHDKIDINEDMIYSFVENNKGMFPKTAQIEAIKYRHTFEKHLKNGDDIIYLALAEKLSGTYQTACLIARDLLEDYPKRKIAVIDSQGATIGSSLILHQMLKLRELDKSFEEIVRLANFYAEKLHIIFLVQDIEWLYHGGRVSRGAAIIGEMLKIKPLLEITDGSIKVFAKVRGNKKAMVTLLDEMEKRMVNTPDQVVGLCNAKVYDLMKKYEKQITKRFGVTDFLDVETIGAALTTHIGNGCIGISFFTELPEEYVSIYP